MDERVQRRLVAILAADVVGYSRLMGADEEGTLARLKAVRREITDPAIATHSGRVVKTTGDGMLIEFASVMDAVRCAVQVQRAMAARGAEEPTGRRLLFRIGINVGDIIVEADDLYGDGVNVASRLEQLSEPGGICISRAVRDHIRDRMDLAIEDLGEQQVKNIARPVRAFRIRLDPVGLPALDDTPAAPATPSSAAPARLPRREFAMAALVLVLVLGGGMWSWWRFGEVWPWRDALAPKRLSVVVLPFANLSDDPQQSWFADGITEDLITDLSRISGAFVIARNTSFVYRGQAVNVRDVARELSVRYALEGSVRREAARVRVNVQLIDAETGAHIWAERFDRELKDVFTLQNEITGRIARALNLELLAAESRRQAGAGSTDAHDLALKAWVILMTKPQTPATNREAEPLAAQAIALDVESALAWTAKCYIHARAGSFGWSGSIQESLRQAIAAGERAMTLDPKNSEAAYVLGYALRSSGQVERSIQVMERAIALNPNNAPAYHGLAYGQILRGRAGEAGPSLDRAFLLSPREPLAAVWHWTAGFARLLIGDDAGAAAAARRAIVVNREFPSGHWLLAAAAAHLGDAVQAQDAIAAFLTMHGGFDTAGKLRTRMERLSDNPVYRAQLDRLQSGLIKAGLPP